MTDYPHNCLTLCPQCKNYPLLSLNEDKPKNIFIQCDHCGYNQLTSLPNYLEKIKTFSNINDDINQLCNNHKQASYKYCTECKLYLCNLCHNHELHKLISLDNIIANNNIKSQVKERYNHISIYCKELKDNIIYNYISN